MDPDREHQLRDLIAKWESKVLELSGTDAVGAADAKIELQDAKALVIDGNPQSRSIIVNQLRDEAP